MPGKTKVGTGSMQRAAKSAAAAKPAAAKKTAGTKTAAGSAAKTAGTGTAKAKSGKTTAAKAAVNASVLVPDPQVNALVDAAAAPETEKKPRQESRIYSALPVHLL